MRTRMANAGLLDVVDAIVLSYEVGYSKPDPRIYASALQRVGSRPAETLFIDDTPGHVATARSLGMAGHVHTSTRDTLARIWEFLQPS
ncbi:HAD family hydrolase [Streptomyces sp. NPDC014733]|uniref:HAD family hydrolase n=1 Tax=Streptomyces sp. NPDC014733 TaxID=3364885 RepID=UPI0036F7707F